ncbi:hypothetical protein CMI37_17740 [Candidatus Pacearchaeota archaeon]|nr:hypothetical protein [Candidatus Pacearchaeota archaeon]
MSPICKERGCQAPKGKVCEEACALEATAGLGGGAGWSGDDPPFDPFSLKRLRQRVEGIVNSLTEEERKVLDMRFEKPKSKSKPKLEGDKS